MHMFLSISMSSTSWMLRRMGYLPASLVFLHLVNLHSWWSSIWASEELNIKTGLFILSINFTRLYFATLLLVPSAWNHPLTTCSNQISTALCIAWQLSVEMVLYAMRTGLTFPLSHSLINPISVGRRIWFGSHSQFVLLFAIGAS